MSYSLGICSLYTYFRGFGDEFKLGGCRMLLSNSLYMLTQVMLLPSL